MTDYENAFQTALNYGRIFSTAAQLGAAPEGTPITDAKGQHWIRGFNDVTERRLRRRKAPRLIWVGIPVDQGQCPSSEIPLPATQVATEDFWPTTLVEGSLPAMTIGSIAGGYVGGDPIPLPFRSLW